MILRDGKEKLVRTCRTTLKSHTGQFSSSPCPAFPWSLGQLETRRSCYLYHGHCQCSHLSCYLPMSVLTMRIHYCWHDACYRHHYIVLKWRKLPLLFCQLHATHSHCQHYALPLCDRHQHYYHFYSDGLWFSHLLFLTSLTGGQLWTPSSCYPSRRHLHCHHPPSPNYLRCLNYWDYCCYCHYHHHYYLSPHPCPLYSLSCTHWWPPALRNSPRPRPLRRRRTPRPGSRLLPPSCWSKKCSCSPCPFRQSRWIRRCCCSGCYCHMNCQHLSHHWQWCFPHLGSVCTASVPFPDAPAFAARREWVSPPSVCASAAERWTVDFQRKSWGNSVLLGVLSWNSYCCLRHLPGPCTVLRRFLSMALHSHDPDWMLLSSMSYCFRRQMCP